MITNLVSGLIGAVLTSLLTLLYLWATEVRKLRGETFVEVTAYFDEMWQLVQNIHVPPIRPESLSRAFLHDAARANLDGSLHTLRHTFISHLVMQGVPLRTVQVIAGHAHFTTTERYAHLAPGYLKNVTAGMRL